VSEYSAKSIDKGEDVEGSIMFHRLSRDSTEDVRMSLPMGSMAQLCNLVGEGP
jgi:hypothetical protein